MVFFPNAKINLGLYITGKRPDGFHNLETIFFPIPFTDAIELIEAESPDQSQPDFNFSSSGIPVDGPLENNLCFRAWQLLKQDYPQIPPVNFHLHKHIPIGAGLGGGSSDAAGTIQLINRRFGLNMDEEKKASYALTLGSDCPFFILNSPAWAGGRGEQLIPIKIPALSNHFLVLVFPGLHISTALAFSRIVPRQMTSSLIEIIHQPLVHWRDELRNDFEAGIFDAYPEIAAIKQQLYQAGAAYASMSGSGSTVYGIFDKNNYAIPSFPTHYTVKEFALARA